MKISRPAMKALGGRVVPAPRPGMRHVEIGVPGQRGFVTDTGKFVNRAEGAKIAKAAGQVPKSVVSLHSEDLPAYKNRKED